jgi:DNA repair exonuclease SbcCD ATPase subunit
MLVIKKLSLRNFLSVGNVVQDLDFDNQDLTLILGENLDLGGNDAGSRNGVGKTTMLQGLSYALFGSAINTIKKDNLINRTNEKNMSATIEFTVRGIDYKITRGRKPNVLKFYVNNAEQVASDDDSQGENRQTQEAIEKVLCMSSTMFQHIVGLNSYTTPFLSMKVGEQREVIEQLLGITLLSEKAEAIKELNKRTKEEIQREEYRIRGIDEANKRIAEQIEALKRRQMLWQKKYDGDLNELTDQYGKLIEIDIEAELQAHRDQTIYNEQVKKKQIFDDLKSRQVVWLNKQATDIAGLEAQYNAINSIDIEGELAAHTSLAQWNQRSKDIDELAKSIVRWGADEKRETKLVEKLKAEVAELEAHKCYACGQDFHDDNHESVLKSKRDLLQEALLQAELSNRQMIELNASLEALGELGAKPVTHYRTEAEAIRHSSEVENIRSKIVAKGEEVDPYADQLSGLQEVVLGTKPVTIYRTETEAVEHRSLVASLEAQITRKSSETDPYVEQIAEMTATGIVELDYSTIDGLNKVLKHQDYLLDLLTNKKSFVRKKIIEQNLSYLNSRLSHYLDKIGLPHRVVFQNDLSVEITELGRDLDFHNLSRGEMNRVILALSFSFRDVFENLFSPVNLLFIDELVDNGMDAVGLDNALGILKDFVRKRNKSVWMVSHKDELLSRVDSVLHVVKENGYTSFRMSDSDEE